MTVVAEPREVVVHAHVAVVDRRDPVLRVEPEARGNLLDCLRLVGVEQVVVERAREERVVDAEERVGHRVSFTSSASLSALPASPDFNTLTL